MVVGLISDTHGLYRPRIAEAFADVDLIVHAGDVGSDEVLQQLARLAPLEAVYGNVDDPHHPQLARERTVPLGLLTLHVSHGHEFPRVSPDAVLNRYKSDILVFGHTHRAVVHREPAGRLVVNPGAAGPRRFNLQPSVGRLLVDGRDARVEIVSL